MNTADITLWELAVYISAKINIINGRKQMIRNGSLVDGISPEDVLKANPTRAELEFYFERMCRQWLIKTLS